MTSTRSICGLMRKLLKTFSSWPGKGHQPCQSTACRLTSTWRSMCCLTLRLRWEPQPNSVRRTLLSFSATTFWRRGINDYHIISYLNCLSYDYANLWKVNLKFMSCVVQYESEVTGWCPMWSNKFYNRVYSMFLANEGVNKWCYK